MIFQGTTVDSLTITTVMECNYANVESVFFFLLWQKESTATVCLPGYVDPTNMLSYLVCSSTSCLRVFIGSSPAATV
jgi:hypothetical protein